MPTGHKWRFFRAGGFDQVRLDSGADLMALDSLDQKLWVALACPTATIHLDPRTLALIDSWQNSPSALQRRVFWYYQGRLRWVGQTPPANTATLLKAIETSITKEEPEVQWAMNFTAGWIGVFDTQYRARCVALGEKTGLYKDQMVSKNCTPDYLPAFIEIESNKRKL
jgi:hypothetical protein